MSVTSLEFLLLLFLGTAVFFRLPSARLRQLAFTAGTAGFVYSYVPDPAGWVVLLGFVLSGYGCAELLRRRPSRVLFTSYIILLIATFAFLKKYDFLKLCIPERFLDLHLQIVGLSYILFRQIHFIVDVMQGQIERPALWAYINYQFNRVQPVWLQLSRDRKSLK
jgi:D-alanyl-lipoteichoic acid acyltransferase DltB (MBOAT superfamily)